MQDLELEFSPLGGRVERDGIVLQVHIYHLVGTGDGWTLEVVDPLGTSTIFEETFASDAAALGSFEDTLEEHGVGRFLPTSDGTVH